MLAESKLASTSIQFDPNTGKALTDAAKHMRKKALTERDIRVMFDPNTGLEVTDKEYSRQLRNLFPITGNPGGLVQTGQLSGVFKRTRNSDMIE